MARDLQTQSALLATRAAIATAVVTAAAVLFAGSPVSAAITPSTGILTVPAGSSGSEVVRVSVPSAPKADIEIAIDTTSSMLNGINQVKAQATDLVTQVQAQRPDTRFAVVDFRDSGDTPEYLVRQSMTADAAAVQAAINTMSPGGGGDSPEAHNLVFRNSYAPASGGTLNWRADSRKFVVVISDAQPHGAATAGLANCTDMSADPHNFNTATELAGMKARQRTLFMVRQPTPGSVPLACYQSIAAAAFTGSQAVDLGANLAAQLLNLIDSTQTVVNDVRLTTVSATSPATPSWISFSPAATGPVTAPTTVWFTVTATVPVGVCPKAFLFDVMALADGSDVGHHLLTVNVPSPRCTTRLSATPAMLDVRTAGPAATPYVLTVNATLTVEATGAAITGRAVLFWTAGGPLLPSSFICQATTGPTGTASCSVPVPMEVLTVAGLGYDAAFLGDTAYVESSAHAPVVKVDKHNVL